MELKSFKDPWSASLKGNCPLVTSDAMMQGKKKTRRFAIFQMMAMKGKMVCGQDYFFL